MDFAEKYIDELIDLRKDARERKDWKLSDDIRNYLDTKYVFIFDIKDNEGRPFQEVHNLSEKFFINKNRKVETMSMNNRQYVEYKMQQDIKAEKNFESWLFSINSSIKKK